MKFSLGVLFIIAILGDSTISFGNEVDKVEPDLEKLRLLSSHMCAGTVVKPKLKYLPKMNINTLV